MTRYALRHGLQAIPLLLFISILIFLLIHLPPGGPAALYAADPTANPADIQRLEQLWGLHDPLYVQYGKWLGNVVRGELGQSLHEHRPVTAVIMERLPATLLLSVSSLLIALLVGIPLGVVSATTPRAGVRYLVHSATILGISTPTFWTGTLLIIVFSAKLRWLPSGGMYTIGAPFSLADRLLHLLGPAVVLGSVYIAQWARYLHALLVEVLQEEYVRVARSKGLRESIVVYRHALPGAAIPLVTLLGLEVPGLLSGALVTEVVFSWPGLGRLLTESLLGRDYPLVMGCLMLLAVAVVAGNLAADLAYGWVDPRVRYA